MKQYNFNFNIDMKKSIHIGVINLGLIFNFETISALGFPSKINIGLDFENKTLAVKKAQNDPNIKEFKFVKNTKRDARVRINSKAIVRAIQEITGITFTGHATPFPAYYDTNLKMLIVNLNKEEEK